MESKELRIGNLVSFNGNPINGSIAEKLIKVERIDTFYIGVSKMNWNNFGLYLYTISVNNLRGIPLTDEILKYTNLKYVSSSYIYLMPKGTIYYNYRIKFEVWSECIKCYIGGFKIEIKYLHELQNLYFTITGEELEIDSKQLEKIL